MAEALNAQFKEKIELELTRLFSPKVPQGVIDEFMKNLCIHGSKVCGFKYIDVKAILSRSDYRKILSITGFDKIRIEDYDDMECNGHSCQPNFGHACDPVTCGH